MPRRIEIQVGDSEREYYSLDEEIKEETPQNVFRDIQRILTTRREVIQPFMVETEEVKE